MSGSWDGGTSSGSPGGGWDTTDHAVAGTAPPSIRVSGAPLHWLLLGIAAATAGIAIPLATRSHPLAILGWALGGITSILLLAAFSHYDLKRRSEGLSRDSALAPWLRRLLLLLAAIAVGLNAWTISDAVARSSW